MASGMHLTHIMTPNLYCIRAIFDRADTVQERLIFENYFFKLDFAATIQEWLVIVSDLYWRQDYSIARQLPKISAKKQNLL